MNVNDCIYSRRSCREYKDKGIPLRIIGEIIEAGIHAPSSGNVQNWVFIVVKDEGKRKKLASLCLGQDWMVDAPVHIVICNDMNKVKEMYPKRGELYSVQNCALAGGNMLLKAEDLGLGSCWVGAFDEVGVKDLLNIPNSIIPEAIITIGHGIKKHKEAERTPINLVSFFDGYGKKNADFEFFPLEKQIKKIEKVKDKSFRKGMKGLRKLKRRMKR